MSLATSSTGGRRVCRTSISPLAHNIVHGAVAIIVGAVSTIVVAIIDVPASTIVVAIIEVRVSTVVVATIIVPVTIILLLVFVRIDNVDHKKLDCFCQVSFQLIIVRVRNCNIWIEEIQSNVQGTSGRRE